MGARKREARSGGARSVSIVVSVELNGTKRNRMERSTCWNDSRRPVPKFHEGSSRFFVFSSCAAFSPCTGSFRFAYAIVSSSNQVLVLHVDDFSRDIGFHGRRFSMGRKVCVMKN